MTPQTWGQSLADILSMPETMALIVVISVITLMAHVVILTFIVRSLLQALRESHARMVRQWEDSAQVARETLSVTSTLASMLEGKKLC